MYTRSCNGQRPYLRVLLCRTVARSSRRVVIGKCSRGDRTPDSPVSGTPYLWPSPHHVAQANVYTASTRTLKTLVCLAPPGPVQLYGTGGPVPVPVAECIAMYNIAVHSSGQGLQHRGDTTRRRAEQDQVPEDERRTHVSTSHANTPARTLSSPRTPVTCNSSTPLLDPTRWTLFHPLRPAVRL